MRAYVRGIDNLPWILKLILALPVFDWIVYGLYRIFKGHIISGIIWLVFGWNILSVVDIICVIIYGNVTLWAR